jgi:Ran GTPase-activating protein (RanGAP) involved in mRNA processing and transport
LLLDYELIQLDLRWNTLGIIGGRHFADTLKWNTSLIELELTGNEIPEDITRNICKLLDRFFDSIAMFDIGTI